MEEGGGGGGGGAYDAAFRLLADAVAGLGAAVGGMELKMERAHAALVQGLREQAQRVERLERRLDAIHDKVVSFGEEGVRDFPFPSAPHSAASGVSTASDGSYNYSYASPRSPSSTDTLPPTPEPCTSAPALPNRSVYSTGPSYPAAYAQPAPPSPAPPPPPTVGDLYAAAVHAATSPTRPNLPALVPAPVPAPAHARAVLSYFAIPITASPFAHAPPPPPPAATDDQRNDEPMAADSQLLEKESQSLPATPAVEEDEDEGEDESEGKSEDEVEVEDAAPHAASPPTIPTLSSLLKVGCPAAAAAGAAGAGLPTSLGGRERRAALGKRLLKAAQDGCPRDVARLLNEGADVNFTYGSRWTPLHRAAKRGHAPVVAQLLRRGANVRARACYGFTPLHLAAVNDASGRCVWLLIRAGADLGSRNRSGRTPLHYAAECGNFAAVHALVEAGANRGARDAQGKTPLDLATDCVRRVLAINA